MFKGLLRNLEKVYQGNEIYIPDALYPLVKDWMERTYFGHKAPDTANLKWMGKTLLPYCEEDALKSYQSCPIHLPERILEKSIVIEASLDPLPEYREEVKVEPEIVEEKVSTRKVVKKRKRRYT